MLVQFGSVGSNSISGMLSREGEAVPLGPNLKARGPLEVWLSALDEVMAHAL